MSFREWFSAHYQCPGEYRYRAIQRLALETGLGWTTILRATNGTRVTVETAERLVALTGGAVTVDSMVRAPKQVRPGPEAA